MALARSTGFSKILPVLFVAVGATVLHGCGSRDTERRSTSFTWRKIPNGDCVLVCKVDYRLKPIETLVADLDQGTYFPHIQKCFTDYWGKNGAGQYVNVLDDDDDGLQFSVTLRGRGPTFALQTPGYIEYHRFTVRIYRKHASPYIPVAVIYPKDDLQTGWSSDSWQDVPLSQMRVFSDEQQGELEDFYNSIRTKLNDCIGFATKRHMAR